MKRQEVLQQNPAAVDWPQQRVLVLGLGGSGVSMIAFLQQQGADVSAYDADLSAEREMQLKQQFHGLPCYQGRLKDALVHGFDILAISPGISERQPEIEAFKQNGGRVFGDIEILAGLLAEQSDKIIAISGHEPGGLFVRAMRARYGGGRQYRHACVASLYAARRPAGRCVGARAFQLPVGKHASFECRCGHGAEYF